VSIQKEYCIYLTYYMGDKLPPFYFGSGTINKIINNGYNGSVSSRQYKNIWDKERKDNPHLFKTRILKKFWRRSMATTAEFHYQKKHNLIYNELYMNKALAIKWYKINNSFDEKHRNNLRLSHLGKVHCRDKEGNSLTVNKEEFYNNNDLISINLNRVVTQDTKNKISKSNIGRKLSEETKIKQSIAKKGVLKSKEHKDKLSAANKGKKFSDERKANMLGIHKGRIHRKEKCPHCNRFISINVIKRYHLDNCKLKNSDLSI